VDQMFRKLKVADVIDYVLKMGGGSK